MEITIEKQTNIAVASISGKVDAITAPELEQELKTIIDDTPEYIILSLDNLSYISSAGLRVILFVAKQLKVEKRELLIAGLSGNTKEVFEISGFYSLFKIFDTSDDAIKSVSQ